MIRALALIAAIWPGLALSQTNDRDYLTALLEDNLSSAGRQVVITGFEGALSSQARMAEMTIADDAGIWLRLTGVVLDWQRSDLLAGRITINSLTAAEIDLARLPAAGSEISAEAPEFSLPELPVAIQIGKIEAAKLTLGTPVLGEVVTASASAALALEGGAGMGQLNLTRLDSDAPAGRADVKISFANDARTLDIDLQLKEGAGGLLARALGIPGAPALAFSAVGAGPLSDFTADINLSSDGAQRFGGQVALLGTARADKGTQTDFRLDLSGDLSALVQPDYRPFFGTASALRAAGRTRPGGGFDLSSLELSTQSLQVKGALHMAASGQPDAFSLTGLLRDPSGAPLILPLTLGQPAAISSAQISASFDASKAKEWTAALNIMGLDHADARMARAEITAYGTLGQTAAGTDFGGDIALNIEGLSPRRAALARALGSVIWGNGRLDWTSGKGPMRLSQFLVGGEDYQITLDGDLGGIETGLAFTGKFGMAAQDLGRFGGMLGQPIAGAGELRFSGKAVLLSGAFDGTLHAKTTDLAMGIPTLDAATAGAANLMVDASRGAEGITLRQGQLRAAGANLDVSGRVSGANTALAGRFDLPDQPLGLRGFGGQVAGTFTLDGALKDAALRLSAQAQGLDFGVMALRPLLANGADLQAEIGLLNLVPSLRKAALTLPKAKVTVAQANPTAAYDITAELADLALIAPQFPGRAALQGRAQPKGDGLDLALNVTGLAGLSAQISGLASAGPSSNLRAKGRADAGIINAFIAPRSIAGTTQFDLTLRGAPILDNVAGTFALQGGQLADPALPFALRDLTATARLGGGALALTATAMPTSGGAVQMQGTISARAPFAADLGIGLQGFGLRMADLVDGSVSGDLRLTGPLAGGPLAGGARLDGRLDLGRTEVQLRPTEIANSAALPTLRHKGSSPAATATRARAGRSAIQPKVTSGPPIALDVTVRAANRVFVRGRGLDAELGGEVRLQGTTLDVRPAGAFDLVKGRFEILGKRLTLEEVRLEMQGQLIPYLYVRATNTRSEVTTTVVIDGPAIDPEIRFSSSPEMPEEEVLAQLLFDQNLTRLSPLQAVQLGSAIATLAGKGDGVLARTRKVLGLDDLDLQTTASGAAALKAGKYVSENVYTELSVEGARKQGLDFTYSLNEKIKLRAGAQTTGNTSLGIEFETNY